MKAKEMDMADMERLETMFREAMGSRYEGSDTQRRLQRIRAQSDALDAQNTAYRQQNADLQQRIADLNQEQRNLLEKATPQGTA